MGPKTIKFFKYILAILGYFKVKHALSNYFGEPFFYDIFISRDGDKVCLIAPYYTLPAFSRVSCLFLIDSLTIESRPSILHDPEKNSLIVSFLIPDLAVMSSYLSIELRKNGKVIFEKKLEKPKMAKKTTLSVTTLFKYEIDFLKEWVEHYLGQGVEHFYLYDNNTPDNNRALGILKPYIDRGLATYIRWPYPYVLYNSKIRSCWPDDYYGYTQSAQINDVIYRFGNQTEWLIYCDIDEYMYSMKFKDIKEAISNISEKNEVASIVVSGKWFGGQSKDIEKLKEIGVPKSFVRSESGFNSPPKCIFHLKNVILASIHKVSLKRTGIDMDISPDIIRFNHYRAMGWKKRIDPLFATDMENEDILESLAK